MGLYWLLWERAFYIHLQQVKETRTLLSLFFQYSLILQT